MQHKKEQCLKCNFVKTCEGIHSSNCDAIEIKTYGRLVAEKKNDLQGKVDAAIDEARDEIKMIQSQLNEMITKDPRISLDEQIQTGEIQLSKTDERENLTFFGLTTRSIPHNKPIGQAPRLCRLCRFNIMAGWGFTLKTSGPLHYINRISRGPAEDAGIRENDRVLEINEEPVDGLTHAQVVQMVRKCTKMVLFLLVK